MNITEVLLQGALVGASWVMWLLIGLSLWSVAIMAERFLFFRRHHTDFGRLIADLSPELARGNWVGVKDRVGRDPSVESAIVRGALDGVESGAETVAELITAGQERERKRTEKGLVVLGTLGNNAPFVGLFGTVIGIIEAFHELSLNPQGAATGVMAGISEALVATGVGLLVALPAVAAYNYFGKRAGEVAQNAEVLGRLILARLRGNGAAAAAAE